MFPTLPIVKYGVSLAAGIPVSKVVGDVIKNNVTVVTKSDALKVKLGGYILTAMIAAPLSKTTEIVVDNAVDLYTKIKNREETDEPAADAVVPEETP